MVKHFQALSVSTHILTLFTFLFDWNSQYPGIMATPTPTKYFYLTANLFHSLFKVVSALTFFSGKIAFLNILNYVGSEKEFFNSINKAPFSKVSIKIFQF